MKLRHTPRLWKSVIRAKDKQTIEKYGHQYAVITDNKITYFKTYKAAFEFVNHSKSIVKPQN